MPLSPLFLLPSPEGHQYYTICYVLAFGVQLALLLRAGYQRGYPLQTWLVLLAASTLAFIIGTKLIALPTEAWSMLQHGTWPATTARSVLGGGLGFVAAMVVLRRWLGFSWHVADAFALPFCAGLVVQCVGCLLTGCCFGEPTNGSWGLTYAPGSVPYLFQQQQGLLPAGAVHSLAVYPTQLYTLLLCAGSGLVLWLTRHRQWPAGSWALLQAGLLVLGRFVIEFWRDPAGEPVGATVLTLGGVSMLELQWLLLPYSMLLLSTWGFLTYRTRFVSPVPEVVPANQPVRNLLVVVGLLISTIMLPVGALTFPELMVVKTVLLAVVVLASVSILHGALTTQRVGLPLAAASVVLLFTNQVPADSAGNGQHWSVAVGGGSGEFNREQQPYDSEGCGNGPPVRPFQHKYKSVSVDATSTWHPHSKLPEAESEVGVRLTVGRDEQQALDVSEPIKTKTLIGINPHFMVNRRSFGLGGGLILGQSGYYAVKGDTYKSKAITPHFTFWLGRRDYIYVQGDLNTPNQGLGNPPLAWVSALDSARVDATVCWRE
ncbi:prolipoprotein diacylglyceryl transferase [Hymenobacter volaticus]|uniref:Prolipoprotein diacylglyceryl transferase n=1 Tax=Hymenobacter volaticus TaxID=2932254 RepID=A0ABY4GA50_9BACT|nr:prolipoprotein diacylglyceryl transferase family protein [Hymenobacter volaticus]UOQ67640.1 prolipoprotein diacylglyceryl transferase [Hymenobacter volaticus]